MLRINCRSCIWKRYLASQTSSDHYATLELKKDATAKDIKAAFYKLSKKYHPDTNPSNSVGTAEKFQKVVEAYEILGTEDKRKAYDYSMSPRYAGNLSAHTREQSGHHSTGTRRKQYTDIDIDYKDFEHFQKMNRRKRVFHEHWDMPNEFSSSFAGSKRDEKGFASSHHHYKDSLHAQREREELRLYQELEEAKKKCKHPLPTFEQLIREEENIRKQNQKKSASIGVTVVMTLLAIAYAITHMS
uniref:J domain-containing protein n=1 Tax=Panagrolaimus sp. ES5 TaxID=591445 RepID=A0AC34G0P0_9BILA